METVVSHDSPLALYLEGEGQADAAASQHADQTPPSTPPNGSNYAPSQRRIRRSWTLKPEDVLPCIDAKPISLLRSACAVSDDNDDDVKRRCMSVLNVLTLQQTLVSSTLGSSDNEHFLEHFRYIIIASHLLEDHAESHSLRQPGPEAQTESSSFLLQTTTLNGVIASTFFAFALSSSLSWIRRSGFIRPAWGKALVFLVFVSFLGLVVYAFARRQWLQFLRRQAIDVEKVFVDDMRAFHGVQGAALGLIQEVELVSKGYKISNPLPPVSRLEGRGRSRKCPRLRQAVLKSFATILSAMIKASGSIQAVTDEKVLNQFLEVYEVRIPDVEEALVACSDLREDEESESINSLKMFQARFGILRRLLLCSLLAIPATGHSSDASTWRTAIEEMQRIVQLLRIQTNALGKLLNEDDSSVPVTPSSPSLPNAQRSNAHSRLKTQVRRISGLSTGIRALQAKLYLLRDDSVRALSDSKSEDELDATSSSLRDQYAALGEDLQVLMQAWEADKCALDQDIHRQKRRVSRSNSLGLEALGRSPLAPHSDLATVMEGGGAIQKSGSSRAPLSPPSTEDGSDGGQDEEVFEATSLPNVRLRSSLTREQRLIKMREDRDRQARLREERDTNNNMLRELQSVIKLRPAAGGRLPHDRGTSI